MTILKDDAYAKASVKGTLASIVSELEEIDSNKALSLVAWLLKKAKYAKEHHLRHRFGRLPDKIGRGDIVRVEFGINVGDELSDEGTDGHFALIWAQNGFKFIVIPLTKANHATDQWSVNLGKIPGMPEPEKDTIAKFEAMRSVSIRRIKRMKEQHSGKLTITDLKLLQKVSDKFQEILVQDFTSSEKEKKSVSV